MGFYVRIVDQNTVYQNPFDNKGYLLPRAELERMGYVYVEGKTEILSDIKLKDTNRWRSIVEPYRDYNVYFVYRGLSLDFLQPFLDNPAFRMNPDAMIEIRLPDDPTSPIRRMYLGDVPTREPLFIKKNDWDMVQPYLVHGQRRYWRGGFVILGHPGIDRSSLLNLLLILSLRAGYTVQVQRGFGGNSKIGFLIDPHSDEIDYCNDIDSSSEPMSHIALEDSGNEFARLLFDITESHLSDRFPLNVPVDSQLVTMMHLAKGISRDEVKEVVRCLSPSVKRISQALDSHDPHDYIHQYILRCKHDQKAVIDRSGVSGSLELLLNTSTFANLKDTTLDYPHTLMTGYPAHVRSERREFNELWVIGPVSPVLRYNLIAMIINDYSSEFNEEELKNTEKLLTLISGFECESRCMYYLQSQKSSDIMTLRYVPTKGMTASTQMTKGKKRGSTKKVGVTRQMSDFILLRGSEDIPALKGSVQCLTLGPTPNILQTHWDEQVMLLGESYYSRLKYILSHGGDNNYFLLHPPLTGAAGSHLNTHMTLAIAGVPGYTLGLMLVGFHITLYEEHDFDSYLQAKWLAYITYRLTHHLPERFEPVFPRYARYYLEQKLNIKTSYRYNNGTSCPQMSDGDKKKMETYCDSLWQWVEERVAETMCKGDGDGDGSVVDWDKASGYQLPYRLCAWSKRVNMKWNVLSKDRQNRSSNVSIPYYHLPLDQMNGEESKHMMELISQVDKLTAVISDRRSEIISNKCNTNNSSSGNSSNNSDSDSDSDSNSNSNSDVDSGTIVWW